MRGGRFIILLGGAAVNLSGASIVDSAGIGTVIGALSVVRGAGNYTYTLTSNPGGLFSISGSNLQVAAALGAQDGVHPITVQANNGHGSIINQTFAITVFSSATQSEPIPVVF